MKPVRRLSLSRTTLRTLSPSELSRVVGGTIIIAAPGTNHSCGCPPDDIIANPPPPQRYPVERSRTPGEVC